MRAHGAVLDHLGRGVADLAVSDGIAWTFTRSDGSFEFETPGTRVVWLRRPSGWSSDRWWAWPNDGDRMVFQVAPSSRGTRSGELTIAHISDTHVSQVAGDPGQAVELAARFGDGTDTSLGLKRALNAAASRGADLAVITGDLTDHGTPAELHEVAARLAASPLPVEIIPGNHDHYGHRHEPAPTDDPKGEGFLGAATTSRYEQALGPRWWSADVAGMHIIGLDWFSGWCGIDPHEQRRFIAADLASRPQARPVVVLSHDVPDDDTLSLLRQCAHPAELVAVLSGHWHADSIRTVDGCHFLSTPAASFGGLDWSAPQIRLLTVSAGKRPTLTGTREVVFTGEEAENQSNPLGITIHGRNQTFAGTFGNRQHLGALASHEGTTLVPHVHPNNSAYLTRLDPQRKTTWTMPVAEERVTGVLVHDDCVTTSSIAGTVTTLDLVSGERRWSYQLPHHHRRRLLANPVATPDGSFIIGDVGAVVSLDARTGAPRWQNTSLGRLDTLLTYGTGVATNHLAVLPLGGPVLGLTAFDLRDGTVVWSDASATPPPSSSVVRVDDTDALVLRTAGPTLERFDLETGQLQWRATLRGSFSTAAPLVFGGAALLVTGDGVVHWIDLEHGDVTRTDQLRGLRRGYGVYRTSGVGVPTSPLLTGSGPVIVLIDGSVWQLAVEGPPTCVGDVGSHVTTQPVLVDAFTIAVLTNQATLHFVHLTLNGRTTVKTGLASSQAL